jgi:hypothetical protein
MGGKTQFPFARYLWPVATGTGSGGLALYVAEQAASQLPFWADLPWRAAVIFAGGWLFGLLYADWMNTDSQLRKWWRKRRDFGEFSEVVFTKTYWDPGADRGGKRAFVDISLPFIFDGDTDLLDVRITAIKHRILFNTNNPEFTELQWTVFGQGKCLANE